MNNILKNFFEKTKTFFHKTKDFNFLVMYIILFYCCCTAFIILGAFVVLALLIHLINSFGFLMEWLEKTCLPGMIECLSLFSIICIPAAITKLFLEKKWSKYLNYFFDHIQYPTIVLICFIAIIKVFNIDTVDPVWLDMTYFTFYSAYFIAFLRKFIKPLYKHLFKIYFILVVIGAFLISIDS